MWMPSFFVFFWAKIFPKIDREGVDIFLMCDNMII